MHRGSLQETQQLSVQLLLVTAAEVCDGAVVLRGGPEGGVSILLWSEYCLF